MTAYLLSFPRNRLNRLIFVSTRDLKSSISDSSHVSLFHTLRNLLPVGLALDPNSWCLSSVVCNPLRSLWQSSVHLLSALPLRTDQYHSDASRLRRSIVDPIFLIGKG